MIITKIFSKSRLPGFNKDSWTSLVNGEIPGPFLLLEICACHLKNPIKTLLELHAIA
jgi:hypothetical protein